MSNDIYSYILDNFGIEITDYQFKRDYIQEPLKKERIGYILNIEEPIREDVYYMYIVKGIKFNDILKILNIAKKWFYAYIKKHKIYKQRKSNVCENFYEIYNIDVTKLTRDYIQYPLYYTGNGIGSELPSKNDVEYLYIEINLPRDEIINYFGFSVDIFDRIMHKYGLRKPIEKLEENSKKSLIRNIGYDNPGKSPEVHKKMIETNLKRHGYTYPFADKNKKEKYKNKEYNDKVNQKIYETKKKNKTLSTSKPEDEIYNLLIQKYPNTIRQHKSKEYPFPCDFYIPELDLYIEYQGYWKHGKEPYIGTDEQKEIVKLWEEKSKEINYKNENKNSFLSAISIWTISDTLKRETAKKNNLNWIEFFNMKQFMDWYNKILENDRKL